MLLNEITQPSDMQSLTMRLQSWKDWLTQGSHTPKEITDELRNNIGDIANVEMLTSPNVDKGDMNASAYYDQDADQDGDIPFGIELYFSDKEDQRMTINNPDPLVDRVTDMMKHEMLHQRQAQARDYEDHSAGKDKRDGNYEYMSRGDEIEAYAMNIADELVKKTSKKEAINLLRMANKTAQFKDEMGNFLSPELFGYMAMWDFDSKHPVIKRLLKKIYQYINMR
jgi:hypothetical protein